MHSFVYDMTKLNVVGYSVTDEFKIEIKTRRWLTANIIEPCSIARKVMNGFENKVL